MIVTLFCGILLVLAFLMVDISWFVKKWYNFLGKPLPEQYTKPKVVCTIETECFWCGGYYTFKTKDVKRVFKHVYVLCPLCGGQDLLPNSIDKAYKLESRDEQE